MKFMLAATLVLAATTSIGWAQERQANRPYSPVLEQFTYSWAAMPPLPRRLQNNCRYHNGNLVCSDNCGMDYQKYFCSPRSIGCCHIGRGYCDGEGHLRCSPALF
jgi:hypothetical protein